MVKVGSILYIGYEYEILYPPKGIAIDADRHWAKEIIQSGKHIDMLAPLIEAGEVRVQSLSQEDLLSLGWESKSGNVYTKDSYVLFLDDLLYIVDTTPDKGYTQTQGFSVLYQGQCKSRNEFKRLFNNTTL